MKEATTDYRDRKAEVLTCLKNQHSYVNKTLKKFQRPSDLKPAQLKRLENLNAAFLQNYTEAQNLIFQDNGEEIDAVIRKIAKARRKIKGFQLTETIDYAKAKIRDLRSKQTHVQSEARTDKSAESIERVLEIFTEIESNTKQLVCLGIGPVAFIDVLSEELRIIARSRKGRGCSTEVMMPDDPGDEDQLLEAAFESNLTGLAFSGGGIRSATFCFGVLQKLAELKLLHLFDYLSTVSGGGYIGSWLNAYIYRKSENTKNEENEGILTVERRIDEPRPNSKDSLPEDYLREYSNYLTPKLGLLGGDNWAFIATYLRNLLLNQSMIVLSLAGLLLTILSAVGVILRNKPLIIAQGTQEVFIFLLIAVAGIVSFYGILLMAQRCVRHGHLQEQTELRGEEKTRQEQFRAISFIFELPNLTFVAFFSASFFMSLALWYRRIIPSPEQASSSGHFRQLPFNIGTFQSPHLALFLFIAGFYTFGWFIAVILVQLKEWAHDTGKLHNISMAKNLIMSAVPAGIAAGCCFLGVEFLQHEFMKLSRAALWTPWVAALVLPSSILLSFAIIGSFHLGFLGDRFPEALREWWSRLGGLLHVGSFLWIFCFGLGIFGPMLLSSLIKSTFWGTVLGSSWFLTSISTVVIGRSDDSDTSLIKRLLLKVGPYLFAIGLLMIVATITYSALINANLFSEGSTGEYLLNFWGILEANPFVVFLLALAILSLVYVMSRSFDINEFSMHHLYRNRLVRCYLGASSANRMADPFTGFDDHDDIDFSELLKKSDDGSSHIRGPYPLMNTTLNLVHGERLAWQERKASSFCITPLYSGYQSSQLEFRTSGMNSKTYHLTSLGLDRKMTLGTAMAISGAAATPNMGYHSSPAVTFLMAAFNVRLGWWVGNPAYSDYWVKSGPLSAGYYLLMELLGRTNEKYPYLYLSDGGHFENLGLYELIKRQCRFIVCVDAAADDCYEYGDLGNAIRKCRIDLGVSIDIDTSQIRGKEGFYYSIGRIDYGSQAEGLLLYIKPCLTKGEPIDVINYQKRNKNFPQQSTANQWFGESQFESYRILGYTIAESLFETPKKKGERRTVIDAEASNELIETITQIKPIENSKDL